MKFWNFFEKTTFGEFVEICEQNHRKQEIQYDENEIIDSSIDLLTNVFLEICSTSFKFAREYIL